MGILFATARFAAGVVVGAAITIALAAVFLPQATSLLPQVFAAPVETRLADGGADAADPTGVAPAPAGDDAGIWAQQTSDLTPVPPVAGAEVGADVAATQPASTPTAEADTTTAGPSVDDESADIPQQLADLPELGPPPTASEPGGDPAETDAVPSRQGEMVGPASRMPVWVPFHSEVSANGFARNLSTRAEHPFTVSKEGPGAYQVYFVFADEIERRTVMEKIEAVTGEDTP